MPTHSPLSLLKQRRFLPFFITQFLGAFNDNVFKNALVILIAFQLVTHDPDKANLLVNLCAGLFVLPFFLFSATAGQLSDKYEKATYIRWVKRLEIAIMVVASAGFLLHNLPLLLCMLFLMGFHSTLFGPVKYSIMPQHLRPEELIGGNAWIEAATYVAILLGTLLGGVLIALPNGTVLVSVAVVLIAVAGYWSSCAIPSAPPADPALIIRWNPLTETSRILGITRQNGGVFLAIIGISWFWFVGSVYLTQLPNFTKLVLVGNEQVVTGLLVLFAVGIGIGSFLCARLSGPHVEIGLVPIGAIGLTLFGVDLYCAAPAQAHESMPLMGIIAFIAQSGSLRIIADIVLMGISGGLFIVPLYASVQERSDPQYISRVIAGNNVLNALFMVVAAIIAIVLLSVGATIAQLFLITALLNVIMAAYLFLCMPEFITRCREWLQKRLHIPPAHR